MYRQRPSHREHGRIRKLKRVRKAQRQLRARAAILLTGLEKIRFWNVQPKNLDCCRRGLPSQTILHHRRRDPTHSGTVRRFFPACSGKAFKIVCALQRLDLLIIGTACRFKPVDAAWLVECLQQHRLPPSRRAAQPFASRPDRTCMVAQRRHFRW